MLKQIKYTYFLICLTIDFWLIKSALFVCDILPFNLKINSYLISKMERIGDKADDIRKRFS